MALISAPGIKIVFASFADQQKAETIFQEELGWSSVQESEEPVSYLQLIPNEAAFSVLNGTFEANSIVAEITAIED